MRKTLKEARTIRGLDINCLWSWIKFEPAGKPGWYWKLSTGQIIPIDYKILEAGYEKICFKYGNEMMPLVEHFMYFRWLLIDGIVVSSKKGSVPYKTGWETLKKIEKGGNLITIPGEIKFFRPKEEEISIDIDGVTHSCKISPSSTGVSKIGIGIDYKTLGPYIQKYTLSPQQIEEVLNLGTHGWPRWRFWIALILYLVTFTMHPYFRRTVWPQVWGKKTLKRFADHRFGDKASVLACMHHTMLPDCDFDSNRSPLAYDAAVVKQSMMKMKKRGALV